MPSAEMALVAKCCKMGDHILDLLGGEQGLTFERRGHACKTFDSVIRRHYRLRVEAARIDDAQPQLSLRPARSGSLEAGRKRALKAFFRVWPAVAEQAKPGLTVNDNGAPAFRVAVRSGERIRDRVPDDRIRTQLILGLGAIGGAASHHGCERDRIGQRAAPLSRTLRR